MKVEKGMLVTVDYSLYADGPEGELLEETNADEPMSFIFGHEDMLEAFEAAIEGKKAGEAFSVLIKSENAYGPEDESAVVDFPVDTFMVDGELDEELLQEGELIPMVDEEGNELLGIVLSVEDGTVTLDFNHPLAGMDLYFDGEVTRIEEPTEADWKALEAGDEE